MKQLEITDFFFRKDRAFSMLLLCWNIPRPLSRLWKTQPDSRSVDWVNLQLLVLKQGTERGLTRRWPLITSSRSNSLEPSRKSLNRSRTMHGGFRCHNTHILFSFAESWYCLTLQQMLSQKKINCQPFLQSFQSFQVKMCQHLLVFQLLKCTVLLLFFQVFGIL